MTFHNHRPLPRLVASGGPVSRALRVMTEADPELARIRALRRAIADRIEADLALLDALSGDCDLEDGHDAELEDEHGGDILDEPHDPQPDDILPAMHVWDPQIADFARVARRQAEVLRARKDREARA